MHYVFFMSYVNGGFLEVLLSFIKCAIDLEPRMVAVVVLIFLSLKSE